MKFSVSWKDVMHIDFIEGPKRTAIAECHISCNGRDLEIEDKQYAVQNKKTTVHSRIIGDIVVQFRGGDFDFEFSPEQLAKLRSLC